MIKRRGFTLIELLIVVAIIIILALTAVISLKSMNLKILDSKRLNDMDSLSRALILIKSETGSFIKACGGQPYSGLVSRCLGQGDDYLLNAYLPALSEANDPVEKDKPCDENCSAGPCNYNFLELTETAFTVKFYLAKGVSGHKAGCHSLTEKGIE